MVAAAPFKILSLDGGGLRGAFSAAVLSVLEDQVDRPLAEYFALIAGTSTGGIIALAVALGLPAHQIREFYRVDGPIVFARSASFWHRLASVWHPKHEGTRLRRALERVFEDRCMRHLRTRVVVPTFSATAGEIRLFKTPHHDRIKRDRDRRLVDVALATSAAPYYLPEASDRDERFLDGGLWANSPVAVAAVEAIGYLGVPRSCVRILSIGTTTTPYHVRIGAIRGGLMGLVHAKPVELLFAAQASGAYATAKVLLGGDEHLLRIDPKVASGRFIMDRPQDLPELFGLGEHSGTHAVPRVMREFLDSPSQHPYIATSR